MSMTTYDNTTARAGSVTINELPCRTFGRFGDREWTAQQVMGIEVRIAAVRRSEQEYEVLVAITGETGYISQGIVAYEPTWLAQLALDRLLTGGPQYFLDRWAEILGR